MTNALKNNTTMTQKIRSALSIALLILLISGAAWAQGTVAPPPKFTGFDNNGLIINAGRLCTYAAGTTTPQATYSDVGLTIANTNPIVLDPAGRATVFLSATSYKFVLRAAGGALTGNTAIDCAATTQLWSQDNVGAIPTTSAGVDIPCTAGEAITAGQAVYWSDGSGGKNAGQCYKTDSTTTYSSTTPWVGMAPNSITSGVLGSIRIAGTMTNLSGLTIGSVYYIGAAGALTATAPTNARRLGQADSATSIVVAGNPGPLTGGTIGQVVVAQGTGIPTAFQAQVFYSDFRLSLTTATCVTTADVTAAGTLYLTPCSGNRITLFDTSGNTETCTTAEISIAVPASTSQMYDVWAYDSTFGTCTVTLELLAWTNDTTRATAVARSNGRWTKSGNTSRLYVGSMRTTTVANQTEDSITNRYVWNMYNRVDGPVQHFEATATWTYGINTTRQANGAAGNQVNFIVGLSEDLVVCDLKVTGAALAGTSIGAAGIGLDSTTTFAGNQAAQQVYWAVNTGGNVSTTYRGYPGIGKHSLMWNEDTWAGGSTITWYGTAAAVGGGGTAVSAISGLLGSVKR